MKKHITILTILILFIFSFCVGAQNGNQTIPEGLIDYAVPPDAIADSIIVYVPNKNMNLHRPEKVDRIIEGRTVKVEKGVQPNSIIHTANSVVVPLESGVPVRLFLKKFSDQDAYYPIAIFPLSSGEKL